VDFHSAKIGRSARTKTVFQDRPAGKLASPDNGVPASTRTASNPPSNESTICPQWPAFPYADSMLTSATKEKIANRQVPVTLGQERP
jgi:hypothetical protein